MEFCITNGYVKFERKVLQRNSEASDDIFFRILGLKEGSGTKTGRGRNKDAENDV